MKLIDKIRRLLGIDKLEAQQVQSQKVLHEMAAAIKNLAELNRPSIATAAPSPTTPAATNDEVSVLKAKIAELTSALAEAEAKAAQTTDEALKTFFKAYEADIDDASKRGRGRPKMRCKKINLALDYDLAMIFVQMKNNLKFNVNDYINRAVRRAAEVDFEPMLKALYDNDILAIVAAEQRAK